MEWYWYGHNSVKGLLWCGVCFRMLGIFYRFSISFNCRDFFKWHKLRNGYG